VDVPEYEPPGGRVREPDPEPEPEPEPRGGAVRMPEPEPEAPPEPPRRPQVRDDRDEDTARGRDEPAQAEEDVLEETPEFLQETPEHDRLWFEQRPPRDFDFDK